MNIGNLIRVHSAALRALLVLTVITGLAYPVLVWAIAQLPGLKDKADGSLVTAGGKVVGSSLIGQLFTDAKGNLKVTKRGREQYLPLLARALLEPDEIWARVEWMHSQARAVVRRRYVARFVVEGEQAPALAVFEHGADGWSGVTTFQGVTQTEDEWRVGVLLYKRLAE